MIGRILIQDFGRHELLDLELGPGWWTVTGASGTGKTTIADAVLFVLFNQDSSGNPISARAIRDGAPFALVQLTLGSHSGDGPDNRKVFGRKLVVKTTTSSDGEVKTTLESTPFSRLACEPPKKSVKHGTRAEWTAALGRLGSDADLCRLIMAPMGWAGAAMSAGGGRELRDILARVAGFSDLRPVITALAAAEGVVVDEKDILDEATLAGGVRTAETRLAEARGTLAACEQALASASQPVADADVEAPADEDVQLAADTKAAAALWGEYDRLVGLREAAANKAAAQQKARSALGERPKTQELDPLRRAHAAASKARRVAGDAFHDAMAEWNKAKAARTEAEATLAGAKKAVDEAEALSTALETVPCKGQTGVRLDFDEVANCSECSLIWAAVQAKASLESLDAAVVAAQAIVDALPAVSPHPSGDAVKAAEKAEADALQALRVAEAAQADAHRWDVAAGVTPVALPEMPAAPEVDRPTADHLLWAADIQAQVVRANEAATRKAGAAAQRAQQIIKAEAALATATTRVAECEAKARRLSVLLAAARQAPKAQAEGIVEALGDLGPVTLRIGDGVHAAQERAIDVFVEGRSWRPGAGSASTGQIVLGDVWLRAAIARTAGLTALPLFVDRYQDFVGEHPLPEVRNLIALVTADGDLEVSSVA